MRATTVWPALRPGGGPGAAGRRAAKPCTHLSCFSRRLSSWFSVLLCCCCREASWWATCARGPPRYRPASPAAAGGGAAVQRAGKHEHCAMHKLKVTGRSTMHNRPPPGTPHHGLNVAQVLPCRVQAAAQGSNGGHTMQHTSRCCTPQASQGSVGGAHTKEARECASGRVCSICASATLMHLQCERAHPMLHARLDAWRASHVHWHKPAQQGQAGSPRASIKGGELHAHTYTHTQGLQPLQTSSLQRFAGHRPGNGFRPTRRATLLAAHAARCSGGLSYLQERLGHVGSPVPAVITADLVLPRMHPLLPLLGPCRSLCTPIQRQLAFSRWASRTPIPLPAPGTTAQLLPQPRTPLIPLPTHTAITDANSGNPATAAATAAAAATTTIATAAAATGGKAVAVQGTGGAAQAEALCPQAVHPG